MTIADIVAVQVPIAGSASPTRQSFGTPCLLAYFDPLTKWQGTYDRIRFYAASSALATLVADGFKATGVIYRAFQVALGQPVVPPLLALARRALPMTQVLKMLCTSIAVGDPYAVTVIGADAVAATYKLTSTGVPATDAASLGALMSASIPSGTTASLVYAAGVVTLTGGAGFTPAMVGQPIQITNATAPANNGTFTIASYISATSVTYANAAGVTDAGGAVHWQVGQHIGAVTVSGATITITQVAGSLTDLQNWTPFLTVSNTTADPGIATDIAALLAANSLGWYGLALDSNSSAEVLAAAASVEATGQGGKFGWFDNADTANVSLGTADVDSTLQALTRVKSSLWQSDRQVLSCSGFGLGTQILAKFPGSYNVAFKSIAGVLADNDQTMTETQQLILNTCSTSQPGTGGKNGNWFKTVSGLNITFPGVTPGGQWIDRIIFCDWLQVNLQADIFAVLAGLDTVPLTDIGIGLVTGAIKSRLKTGSLPPYGGIDNTRPIIVNGPPGGAASMSTQDRNNRNLSGITGSFFFTGAILSTELVITGTP